MRKLSQINERLFNGGVSRAASGDERLETKLIGNIKDLKPIDLGDNFLWSDMDLEVEGEEWFDYKQIKEDIEPKLEQYGWRLPTWNELLTISPYKGERIRTGEKITYDSGNVIPKDILRCSARKKSKGNITCDFTGNQISAMSYFVKYERKRLNTLSYEIFYMMDDGKEGHINLRLGTLSTSRKCRIRLIKDR